MVQPAALVPPPPPPQAPTTSMTAVPRTTKRLYMKRSLLSEMRALPVKVTRRSRYHPRLWYTSRGSDAVGHVEAAIGQTGRVGTIRATIRHRGYGVDAWRSGAAAASRALAPRDRRDRGPRDRGGSD